MRHVSLENIYNDIMLLSNSDRDKLYNRMKEEFYHNSEIIAYTTDGKPLNTREYIEQINIGLKQIETGEVITDDELEAEIKTW